MGEKGLFFYSFLRIAALRLDFHPFGELVRRVESCSVGKKITV